MVPPELSDETLMAYADGELSDADRAEIDELLETDDAAAQRVKVFRATRQRLADAAVAQDHVPAALRERVQGLIDQHQAAQSDTTVVSLASRQTRSEGQPRFWGIALAASLALAIGFGGGFWIKDPRDPEAAGPVLLSGVDLTEPLSTLKSGETLTDGAASITIIGSFRDGDGRLCREAQLSQAGESSLTAVLCHSGSGWSPELAIRISQNDGFTLASGPETVETFLATIGAGALLSPEEELQALTDLQR